MAAVGEGQDAKAIQHLTGLWASHVDFFPWLIWLVVEPYPSEKYESQLG